MDENVINSLQNPHQAREVDGNLSTMVDKNEINERQSREVDGNLSAIADKITHANEVAKAPTARDAIDDALGSGGACSEGDGKYQVGTYELPKAEVDRWRKLRAIPEGERTRNPWQSWPDYREIPNYCDSVPMLATGVALC